MSHKPLEYIKNQLVWLPISGPALAGRPIAAALLPFQENIIKAALSPSGRPSHNVFIGFSRKISKSLIYSLIASWALENKEGYQGICAASTYEQSDIIFSLIKGQIMQNPAIHSKNYKITKDKIQNRERGNCIRKIYSAAASNLGYLNISFFIADELGAWPSRANLDSILSGLAMAQDKPLLLFAANRPELESHWSNEYLKGLAGDKDWKFFEFAASPRMNIYSKQAKAAANPFYKRYAKVKEPLLKGVYNFINKEAERAKKSSENEIVYRKYALGQAVSSRAYSWIKEDDLQSFKDFPKERAVMGFDISYTANDFCAAVIVSFEGDKVYCLPILHLANAEGRRPAQRRQFEAWNRDGFIKIQGRQSVDKSIFIADCKETLRRHKISPLSYVWDPAYSAGFREEFSEDPVCYRQSPFQLSQAIRWLEARGREQNIYVNNPALRYMVGSAICSVKSKAYILLDRSSRWRHIDGAVSMVMCAKWHIENPPEDFQGFAI